VVIYPPVDATRNDATDKKESKVDS
jgi:hypothetical protein